MICSSAETTRVAREWPVGEEEHDGPSLIQQGLLEAAQNTAQIALLGCLPGTAVKPTRSYHGRFNEAQAKRDCPYYLQSRLQRLLAPRVIFQLS